MSNKYAYYISDESGMQQSGTNYIKHNLEEVDFLKLFWEEFDCEHFFKELTVKYKYLVNNVQSLKPDVNYTLMAIFITEGRYRNQFKTWYLMGVQYDN